mmetsp:Transcript_41660/g.103527  ORF Transcript_41660/g.103527 Transcript_41660/m.103527 type:complete len:227 (-) Transcript_41660:2588-3268(-)
MARHAIEDQQALLVSTCAGEALPPCLSSTAFVGFIFRSPARPERGSSPRSHVQNTLKTCNTASGVHASIRLMIFSCSGASSIASIFLFIVCTMGAESSSSSSPSWTRCSTTRRCSRRTSLPAYRDLYLANFACADLDARLPSPLGTKSLTLLRRSPIWSSTSVWSFSTHVMASMAYWRAFCIRSTSSESSTTLVFASVTLKSCIECRTSSCALMYALATWYARTRS